jgi:hypothetical protein
MHELIAEVRQELATTRVAALHRSAEPLVAGPLRRALGRGLVRLGLRLGYDGRVPPFVPQPDNVGTRLEPGTHAPVRALPFRT